MCHKQSFSDACALFMEQQLTSALQLTRLGFCRNEAKVLYSLVIYPGSGTLQAQDI